VVLIVGLVGSVNGTVQGQNGNWPSWGRGHDEAVSAILRGEVVSGLGDLSRWMELYQELYTSRVGTHLFPGSLNVSLATEWSMARVDVRLDPAEYGGIGMNIARCEIEGIPAFILRTDRNEEGTGHHPRSLIEIASAVHLRMALSLVDGTAVTVIVPGARVG
jgi:riboflavin kinase, archaea type